MENEKEQLEQMTDQELVAYWNILQYPTLGDSETVAKKTRHLPIVDSILSARNIPHEIGKRTTPE